MFGFGNVIMFSYIGKRSHDPHPKVLVLAPNYQGVMHGLNLKYISSNYIELIKFLMQKDFKGMKDQKLYKSFYRWKNLMPKNLNGLLIYNTFVSRIQPIRAAYRKYIPKNMRGVKILSSKLV